MNSARVFYAFVFLFFISSCASLKESHFVFEDAPIFQEIPPMDGAVDMDSVMSIIRFRDVEMPGYYKGNIEKKNSNSGNEKLEKEGIKVPEIRAYDMLKVFSNLMSASKTDNKKESWGTIEFELLEFNEYSNVLLSAVTILTIGTLPLVGIPANVISTTLKVKVTVYNKSHQEISSYVASGFGRAAIAMYWGYGKDAWRVSSIKAFKDALSKIDLEMSKDPVWQGLRISKNS